MHRSLFSDRDITAIKIEHLSIEDADKKLKILGNWQKGIISGKIRSQNEKKLQSEFLNKIFGDVLGYSYEKHLDQYQLDNEVKVSLDGKTPDGALGFFEFEANGKISQDIRVVIELKGPLVNLDKKQNRADFKGTPIEQAFSYVPKLAKPCPWVIVSNCQEIRLYRYALGMSQYQRFDMLDLVKPANFKHFCYVLQQNQLFTKVLENSVIEDIFNKKEEELKTITNKFYEEYKQRREDIFDKLRQHNPQTPPVELLRHTQKLIDRLIFMCFARDLYLVGDVLKMVEIASDQTLGQEEDKVWQELKKAFIALDKGYASKNIPPFNGGLFRRDEALENLVVKDIRLQNLMSFLQCYNYRNQLNINVLGHIFEQSISDIEGIKKRLETEEPIFNPPTISDAKIINKRKTDGVFYTPEYITRYIVEQAVGAWLDDREDEIFAKLGIEHLPELTEEDYKSIDIDKKTGIFSANAHIKIHLKFWEEYELVLKKIKVLDPTCGSGAFLTQVFDFLWERWRVMKDELDRLTTPYDEQLRKLAQQNGELSMDLKTSTYSEWNIKKNIIQHNLFGVDLNPESVEITKLSLWLKTANKTEKLANMDGNIRHGNSLIADPDLSEAAFDWQVAFPEVFVAGGFDVVVGNPPYVRQELLGKDNKEYYTKRFPNVGNGTADLYVYFYELGLSILQSGGYLSYITPNKWFKTKYGREIRHYLKPFDIRLLIDFFELKIFDDAATEPQILVLKNRISDNSFAYFPIKNTQDFVERKVNPLTIQKNNLQDSEWVFADEIEQVILEKLQKNTLALGQYGKIYRGVLTGLNRAFIIDQITKENIIKTDPKSAELIKPYTQATDIKAWHLENKGQWFFINTGFNIEISEKKYVGIYKYLRQFDTELEARQDKGKTIYNLRSCDYYEEFDKPKILYIHTAVNPHFYFDTEKVYINNNAYIIANADLFISSWLNSSIFNFYKKLVFPAFGDAGSDGRVRLNAEKMINVPIPLINEVQKASFITEAEAMLTMNKQLYEQSQRFLSMVRSELKVEKVNEKLEKWFVLSWEAFLVEIKKQKGSFGLTKQMEFQTFFTEQKVIAQKLHDKIQATDQKINSMVYALYDLTPQEIAVVEA
jgi:Eco57I restriction-modification methylase/TaqI-like C-terminal specificity domain